MEKYPQKVVAGTREGQGKAMHCFQHLNSSVC